MPYSSGYPLPAVGEDEPELTCCIIYLPDAPEYRRALMGSLDFLATWKAWQREPLKRGRTAAALWKNANELTQECFDMGCFDELLTAIQNLDQSIQVDCYCEFLPITPPTPPSPTGIPGAGPVPPTWGDEDTTGYTWGDYNALVCGAANDYVDFLKNQNAELMNYLNLGILGLGVLAALIALVTGFGIAVVIGLGAAASIFQALIASPGASVFANVPAQLEAARDDIVQAITCDGNLAGVIESAIDSLAWDLFYQWVDWEAATAIIRSGQYGGETLPTPQPAANCDCAANIYNHTFTYDATDEGWTGINGVAFDATCQCLRAQIVGFNGVRAVFDRDDIAALFGFPPGTQMDLLYYRAEFLTEGDFLETAYNVGLAYYHDNIQTVVNEQVSGPADSAIVAVVLDEGVPLDPSGIQINFGNKVGGPAQHIQCDNVTLTVRILGSGE